MVKPVAVPEPAVGAVTPVLTPEAQSPNETFAGVSPPRPRFWLMLCPSEIFNCAEVAVVPDKNPAGVERVTV